MELSITALVVAVLLVCVFVLGCCKASADEDEYNKMIDDYKKQLGEDNDQ